MNEIKTKTRKSGQNKERTNSENADQGLSRYKSK